MYLIRIPWPEIFSTCLSVMCHKSHNYEGIWSCLLQAHISESIHNIEGFNRFIFLKIILNIKWHLELVCFKFAQYTLSTKVKRFTTSNVWYSLRSFLRIPVKGVWCVHRERPVINTRTVNLDYLQSLPQGTFGREYADWLHVNVCRSDSLQFSVFHCCLSCDFITALC